MADEKGRNKKKRERKRIERLKLLLNIDFCACGGGNQLKCTNLCRELHTNSKTKMVECGEMYQIDDPFVSKNDLRRPRRKWKYGRQKENIENKENDNNRMIKQRRREKIERDRS